MPYQIDQTNQTDQSNQIGQIDQIDQIDQTDQPVGSRTIDGGQWKKCAIPPLWDGKATERSVEYLERVLRVN